MLGAVSELDAMLDGAAGGTAEVAPGWGQGRATYGGLVAGLLVAYTERLVAGPARRLRSAAVSFVGPVAPGAVQLDGTILRAGRAMTQVTARALQDGEPRAVLLAAFGQDRDSGVAVGDRDPRPAFPAPEEVERVPVVPGRTPEFFGKLDLRFAAGNVPFSGAGEPDFGGWVRFADPPREVGDRELVALADAWPPALVPLFDRPVPVSTVTWSVEMVGPRAVGAPDAFWQFDARTTTAAHGYTSFGARIWDAGGRLRVVGRQTVAYFG